MASRIEGRTLHRMFREPGERTTFEDEIKVVRFRRILEPTVDGGKDPARGSNPSEASRKARLLQVWDDNGHLRTLAVEDIIDVS